MMSNPYTAGQARLTPVSFPVAPVVLPAALQCGSRNGMLGLGKLADIGHGGRLEVTAARCWNALWLYAKGAGHSLTWTPGGTYRTFDNQVAVFMQRMQTGRVAHHYIDDGGAHCSPTAPGAVPIYVTRFYMGQVWYLRPGDAMVATPGTSNHGLGLAVDLAVGDSPEHALYIGADADNDPATATALAWLLDGNAQAFGFSWEAQSEPWHIRYVNGDVIPSQVLNVEAFISGLGPA